MKIAFVYDAIYPFNKGGAEKRFLELAKRLHTLGHEVHLYGMKYWSGDDVIVQDGIFLHGLCKAKSLYNKKGRRSIFEAVYFGVHCLKLLKEQFDLIDCANFPYFSLFVCKFVARLKNKVLFCTWLEVWGREYWSEYLPKLGYIGYLVERLSSVLPDVVTCISNQTGSQYKKLLNPRKDIHIIPVGIEFDNIRRIEASTDKSDVIYAGRLLKHKNVDILIKAVGLINRYRELRLIIVGDGPEKENLIALVKNLRLEKKITFLGFFYDQREMLSMLKSSRLFVLPSEREGFGLVVLEANACGIPVLTVDSPGNAARTLIGDGVNGRVCRLDEQDMANHIVEMFETWNGQICIEFAEKYDWKEISSRIENLYRSEFSNFSDTHCKLPAREIVKREDGV